MLIAKPASARHFKTVRFMEGISSHSRRSNRKTPSRSLALATVLATARGSGPDQRTMSASRGYNRTNPISDAFFPQFPHSGAILRLVRGNFGRIRRR
jgi:hypothetical protein